MAPISNTDLKVQEGYIVILKINNFGHFRGVIFKKFQMWVNGGTLKEIWYKIKQNFKYKIVYLNRGFKTSIYKYINIRFLSGKNMAAI